jgi:hypothetical protein
MQILGLTQIIWNDLSSGKWILMMKPELKIFLRSSCKSSSSSSSLARQPYVGPGLLQSLSASSGFVTRVFSSVGSSASRPTPSYPVGPMFSVRVVSLS